MTEIINAFTTLGEKIVTLFLYAAGTAGEAIKNFKMPTFTTIDIIPIIVFVLLAGFAIKRFYFDRY